jgi:large subunit ribosomal protein L22
MNKVKMNKKIEDKVNINDKTLTEKKDEKDKKDVVVEKNKELVKKKEIKKKNVVIARGVGLRISPKQCVYVCKMIRGKSPDAAIARLQDVIDEKRAVPMIGLEVGHKKGKGLAGGKFPKTACKAIVDIVKQAAANAVVAEIENPFISIIKSDKATSPFRRDGRRAKRCHIYVEIRNKEEKK